MKPSRSKKRMIYQRLCRYLDSFIYAMPRYCQFHINFFVNSKIIVKKSFKFCYLDSYVTGASQPSFLVLMFLQNPTLKFSYIQDIINNISNNLIRNYDAIFRFVDALSLDDLSGGQIFSVSSLHIPEYLHLIPLIRRTFAT